VREGLPENHGLAPVILANRTLVPVVDGRPLLTDIQYEALAVGVARGQSAIVSAPTSTGKTLVGLWTIAAAVLQGHRAVYLVSHRALARQKFDEMRTVLGVGILEDIDSSLVIATGDGVEDAQGRRVANALEAQVLVATYEKFLHSLAVNGPPRDLRDVCIVCDEIQLIGDKHRGGQVELLLTLLKRAGWRQLIALSAVLSPRDVVELSEWLGVSPLRNPRREKTLRIECRAIDGLLYTIAHPDHGVRPVAESEDRLQQETTEIVRELMDVEHRKPVIVFCMRIEDTYTLASTWVQNHRGPVIAVARPPGAEVGGDLLQSLGRRAAYHNAELTEDERELVEQRLQGGQVDVVFATSTLAAGVNFPLGSAVFHSWKRFNFERQIREPISRSEFQNMAGRVGRMGQAATEGLVVMSALDAGEKRAASGMMDLEVQDELVSRIGPADFGQLVLHIFAGGLCDNREAAYGILSNTFSASRELERNRAGLAGWEDRINAEIDSLIQQECLVQGGTLRPTLFGIAVANTGLKPATVNWFLREVFNRSEFLKTLLPSNGSPGDEDALAFILAHAAMASPEFSLTGGRQTRFLHWRLDRDQALAPNPMARRLSPDLFVQPWTANVAAANGALLVGAWAAGKDRSEIERLMRQVRLGIVQSTARDISWILTGVAEVIGRITAPSLDEEVLPAAIRGDEDRLRGLRALSRTIRRHAVRIGLGLSADVVWMNSIEQAGNRPRLTRAEIISLRAAGLTTPLSLMRGDPDAVAARRDALAAVGTVDGGAAARLRDAVRAWKEQERAHCRRLHERRAVAVDAVALVRRLYEDRREVLEASLEEAFLQLGIPFTKLDDGMHPGRPDYLLEFPDLPPIVAEVKSREAENHFIGLQAATEVLAASELMGRGADYCLTICSPAVDPSVPGLVEGCERLCVVDICDFVDAVVRVLRGDLELTALHNWLTTPGIALMGDLPPSD
jgi:helicase